MPINPITSANSSFGKNNNSENKKVLLSTSAAGAIIGAAAANFSKIKTNPENIDNFVKTIEEKLPMSSDTKTELQRLKETIKQVKTETSNKLQNLGITPETKEITVDSLLKNIIHPDQPDKTIQGLANDIEFIEGEARSLKTQLGKNAQYREKLQLINERKNIKKLIEESVDGKIDANKIRNIYSTPIQQNPKISGNVNVFNALTKKFNKQRLALFTVVGLVLGAVVGSFIKINNKNK